MLSVAAALLTMSCSNESSLFQRENDVVTCDCSEQISASRSNVTANGLQTALELNG